MVTLSGTAIAVIPLPPAAMAGFGTLAMLAGFGALRRRRVSRA
jgi:MYXO-CTERM domain-containing protein